MLFTKLIEQKILLRVKHLANREINCIIGKKTKDESALLTLTERKTRMEIMRKLPAKSAHAVLDAINKHKSDGGGLYGFAFKSITADNGSEFSELASLPYSNICFAHPHSSFERGTG